MSSSSFRLTDLSVKNLPIPTTGQITYDDDASPLKVRVTQTGVKTFLVFVGSGRRHTIGRYGDITLQQARAAAVRVKAEKTLGRVFPEAMSVSSARELYLSQIKIRPKTRDYYVRHLNELKASQVRDVTARDINHILDSLPTPSRTQALASFRPFFKWCIKRNYLDRSPCELMTGEVSPSRERVLSEHELQCVWRACEDCGQFGVIVKILMLTGQRETEIAHLRESWIKDDTILFPKDITKNKRPHLFPIGPAAAALLASVRSNCSQTGAAIANVASPKGGALLFPARGTSDRPFSGWSKCKRNLDQKLGSEVEQWTLHDLRRTFATNLAALGVRLEVTEKLLNHVSGSLGGIVAVYQRHDFKDEMREAMEKWEARLAALLTS
ncbi:MAG: site-specific integrase [Roseiarcus sp.]|jgi:integrase